MSHQPAHVRAGFHARTRRTRPAVSPSLDPSARRSRHGKGWRLAKPRRAGNPCHSVGNLRWVDRHRSPPFAHAWNLTIATWLSPSHARLPGRHDLKRTLPCTTHRVIPRIPAYRGGGRALSRSFQLLRYQATPEPQPSRTSPAATSRVMLAPELSNSALRAGDGGFVAYERRDRAILQGLYCGKNSSIAGALESI
jgi:hypothetical protein